VNGFQGEFFGTMILILLGDGVVAGVLLNRSKAQNSGWIVITAGWAFAVMAGVFTARWFGGAGFINPVGPLAALVLGDLQPDAAAPLVRAIH
jgi:glycerol uptake facilitator protein